MMKPKINLIILADIRDDEDRKFYQSVYFSSPNLLKQAVVVILPTVESFFDYVLSMPKTYQFKVLVHLHKRGGAVEIGEKLYKGIVELPTKRKLEPLYVSREPINKHNDIKCIYEPELNSMKFDFTTIPTNSNSDILDPKVDYAKLIQEPKETGIESIVILTALPLELREVKRHLPKVSPLIIGNAEDRYEETIYETPKQKFRVIIRTTGKLNVVSAKATSDALSHIKPKYIFYVGIAGKLKDVEIGHVVAADKVEGYEPANVGEQTKTRIFQGDADRYLLQTATSIVTETNNSWLSRVKNKPNKSLKVKPESHIGRIATGEKVLSDINSETYQRIRHDCSDSLAVECEGGGFYHVCNQEKAKGLLVRGISDKLKDKAFAEELNSQPYAAACAAAFLFEVIDRL